MGWGICFGLDSNGRVYCRDGCKWRTTKSDYDDYPVWPSARQSVLDYYEGDAHRELDMVRDECPGTAAGLRAACDEHLSLALRHYHSISDEQKQKAHEDALVEFEADLVCIKDEITRVTEMYKAHKKHWIEYKKDPPKVRASKTRAEELRQLVGPLCMELEMEEAAEECDRLQKAKANTIKMIKLEKKFHL